MQPIVSILMPTYNHEKYISQAIESALSQKTQYDWELLINDDCSTDNTRKIAQKYAEKYPEKIKLIYPETNQGLMKSYKRLLEIAQGKYIAILESDDIWISEEKLEKQVSFLEENEEYGLCATATNLIDSNDKILKKDNSNFDENLNGDRFNELLYANTLKAVSVVFKKSLFDIYCNIDEYIENKFMTLDYPVWLSISAHSKCKYIHEFLSSYRIIGTSISNSNNYKKKKIFEENVRQIQNYIIEKYPPKNFDYFRFEEISVFRFVNLALKNKQFFDFIKYAKKLKSNDKKRKFMHNFPILFYIQHRIRIH